MRIRTVKPEFWRSADTAELTFFARLLYIGLWNFVDDNGVGDDDEALIRSDLFPRDDVDETSRLIHEGLTELSVRGQILRYEDSVSERRYLKVVAWHHQKINRPSKSSKPLPASADTPLSEGSSSDDGALRGPSVNTHGGLTEDSPPYLGIKVSRDQGRRNVSEDSVSASEATDPTPPSPNPGSSRQRRPRCARHARIVNDSDVPACPDCGALRTAAEEHRKAAAQKTADELAAVRRVVADCPDCGDHGYTDTDPAEDCQRHPVIRKGRIVRPKGGAA